MKQTVLVTGGAGYIGSHTVLELLAAGFEIVIIDNFSNSKPEVIHRIQTISGKKVIVYAADVRDRTVLNNVFLEHKIDAVIHFAGFKAVGESVEKPLLYYHNNLVSTISLCETMVKFGVNHLVFSSSATVYGAPASVPVREHFPTSATNPYGRSKLMIEEMLRDLVIPHPAWNIAILRYFNPVGAHESGLIGEDPNGLPNNLMPFISQVAVGKLPQLRIFGNDYPTPDGTGVRDYIHVVDLAKGHVQAISKLLANPGLVIYNLGTGTGYSVLEMVKAFSHVSGRAIPYEITARRLGDIAEIYADPQRALDELGWKTELDLKRMCADSWRWQSKNPNGYE